MPELSVIIPARQETWLLKTVESIRAAIRGDTEIIAVLDGEEAEPKLPAIWPDDGGPPVKIVRNGRAMGQRQSINIGVQRSKARFILKTDAHSFLEEGFDVKLMADCEPDWTVIPRMYNLHSHDQVCNHCGERYYNRPPMEKCEKCGSVKVGNSQAIMREVVWDRNLKKPPTDWMFFRSYKASDQPLRVQYWDAPTSRDFPAEYRAHKEWAAQQGEISDVMTGQGACWMMYRDRFWELGGMDEAHGHWGQMGVEVACKSWLSGGRQVVNRKTWFAHLFRCGGSEGCPWEMSGRQQDAARKYSIDLWSNNKWAGQKRPLEWLVEKFWPVPTWDRPEGVGDTSTNSTVVIPTDWKTDEAAATNTEAASAVEATEVPSDLTVLYYTDDSLPAAFSQSVLRQIRDVAGDVRVIECHQPADWPRNHESIYRNILAGLERVKTPFVALAEHDVLYPKGYFDHRPHADFEYNINRWCLHADHGVFSRRPEWALSQLIARTDVLTVNLTERLKHPETCADHSKCFEPGKGDESLGMPTARVGVWKCDLPTIDITGHGFNLTGPKRPRGRTRERVKPWGMFAEVMQRYSIPSKEEVFSGSAADSVALEPGWYTCTACHRTFTVDRAAKISPIQDDDDVTERMELACPNCGALDRTWEETAPAVRTSGKPKISVLIPARNEPYLQQTIDDLCRNLRLDYEIVVGLDGYQPDPPLKPNERVLVIHEAKAIGMRPMINKLARAARGEYLMRMDAHCSVAEGIDKELVETCEREGHVTCVAMRYELDVKRWKRRDKTDVPYRRLSHESEDGRGLRSLPWPEYGIGREKNEIDETMTCSGSSWTCRRSTFVDWWGGFDEKHGTFGQEGCEISCMTWLSGGRFLVNKRTWYAHWNRGKTTYAMGVHTKQKSIDRSKELWVGNQWKHARYGFDWLLEKFHPPGWPEPKMPEPIKAVQQHSLCKTRKRLRVDDLWNSRDAIADPGKRHRLQIFWRAYDEFVRSVLAGQPLMDGQYRSYLLSHISRNPIHRATRSEIRKVDRSMQDSLRLIASVQKEGLRAPMEFYQEDGRMILWKGYRRLVIARAVGIPRVVGRCYGDRQAAGALSPQMNLTRLRNPQVCDLHKLAEDQFRRWGNGATDKYYTHNYTRLYDLHLDAIRKRAKRVLELGLLNGASLALWRDYFPKARIVGVDIDPERWKKFAADLPNSKIMIGSETDAKFMATVAKEGPFDLIVDDASHDPALQRPAWEMLWHAVRQYGFYVIEDTFRSWEKGANITCIPAGLESRIYQERDVLAVHHYHNIIFIQKA